MVKSKLWAVGLGLLTVFAQTGFAEELASRPYCPCPPGYKRVCPPGHVAPPKSVHPSDLPSDTDPNMPDMPDMPDVPDAPDVPQPQPPANLPTSAPSQAGTGLAGLGGGANTPMLGRLDSSNRLNLFDNMTAIPRSRVWFAYLNAEGQDAALIGSGFANRNNTDVYRAGVELAITEEFSIATQVQYVNPYDTGPGGVGGGFDEDFTDPQIMAKYVVYHDRDCCGNDTVVSATLGFQLEASNDANVIDNDGGRVYPGMLFYKEHNSLYYSQGGMQVGIPIGEDPATFDWSYSLGYWAYKHRLVDNPNCCCCSAPFVIGVAPQIGILGKHVWGDNDVNNPFRGGPLGGIGGPVVLDEARHVFDATVGAAILFQPNFSMGLGYSVPITGTDARRGEFIASLNWYF